MSDRPKPRLPEVPTGIDQPHDVLAAEEFAMPVGGGVTAKGSGRVRPSTLIPSLLVVGLLVAGLVALLRD